MKACPQYQWKPGYKAADHSVGACVFEAIGQCLARAGHVLSV